LQDKLIETHISSKFSTQGYYVFVYTKVILMFLLPPQVILLRERKT